MWRVPAVPIGAHTLLSLLAEPLKQLSENHDMLEDYDISDNLREFQDWVCFILTHLVGYFLACFNIVPHNNLHFNIV